jgi:hypothetical protein
VGAIAPRCKINQLITRSYNDLIFTFRDDGYFNMTKAANCFDKQLQNFWNSPDTPEYMDAVSKTLKSNELVQAKAGRYGGTWAHPKLAIFFARWLDVGFAVWCDAMIEDILEGEAMALVSYGGALGSP